MTTGANTPSTQLKACQTWFENLVLGLNLCPFAHKPARDKQIRWVECNNSSLVAISDKVLDELDYLAAHPEVETTLICVPQGLEDFYFYNEFLASLEQALVDNDYEGIFQIASFHPDYQFADSEASDVENYTNRAPQPLFHLIREQSLEDAINNYADIDQVPLDNMEKMRQLSPEQLAELFPYLQR